jgi:hypothetical protein
MIFCEKQILDFIVGFIIRRIPWSRRFIQTPDRLVRPPDRLRDSQPDVAVLLRNVGALVLRMQLGNKLGHFSVKKKLRIV